MEEFRKGEQTYRKVIKKAEIIYEYISIPVFPLIQILNIARVDISELIAEVNAVVKLCCYYQGFWMYQSSKIKKHGEFVPYVWYLLEKLTTEMMVDMPNRETISLSRDNDIVEVSRDENKKTVEFSFRNNFQTLLLPDVSWSPFQKYSLLLSLHLKKIFVETWDSQLEMPRHTEIRFNFMKPKDKNILPITFSEEKTSGFYEISPDQTEVDITFRKRPRNDFFREGKLLSPKTKSSKNMENTKQKYNEQNISDIWKQFDIDLSDSQEAQDARWIMQKIKVGTGEISRKRKFAKPLSFSYFHIKICIFREPILNFCTLILPMFLLNALNLFTFFMENPDDKVKVIVITMVAFIALIQTTRNQLPPYKSLTFVQIILMAQLLIILVIAIQAFRLSIKSTQYTLLTPEFIIACLITVCSFLIIFSHLVYYCCIQRKKLRRQKDQIQIKDLDRQKWSNNLSNFFYQLFDRDQKSSFNFMGENMEQQPIHSSNLSDQ